MAVLPASTGASWVCTRIAGATTVAETKVAGDADAALLEEIARRGAAHCPACDAVKRAVPVKVDVATS